MLKAFAWPARTYVPCCTFFTSLPLLNLRRMFRFVSLRVFVFGLVCFLPLSRLGRSAWKLRAAWTPSAWHWASSGLW